MGFLGKKNVGFGAWAFGSGRRRQPRSGSMRLCKIETSNALTNEYERPRSLLRHYCDSLYRILMTAKKAGCEVHARKRFHKIGKSCCAPLFFHEVGIGSLAQCQVDQLEGSSTPPRLTCRKAPTQSLDTSTASRRSPNGKPQPLSTPEIPKSRLRSTTKG